MYEAKACGKRDKMRPLVTEHLWTSQWARRKRYVRTTVFATSFALTQNVMILLNILKLLKPTATKIKKP